MTHKLLICITFISTERKKLHIKQYSMPTEFGTAAWHYHAPECMYC